MTYLLAVLGVFFWARTIALMDGPFGLCAWVRERVDPLQQTWVGRGLNCPICVGFWIALIASGFLPYGTGPLWLLTWFGLAGANALLHLWSIQWAG